MAKLGKEASKKDSKRKMRAVVDCNEGSVSEKDKPAKKRKRAAAGGKPAAAGGKRKAAN